MEVIGHGKDQSTAEIAKVFPDGDRFVDRLPSDVVSQLVESARNTTDGDEIDVGFGIGGIDRRPIVGQILASDVVHSLKR